MRVDVMKIRHLAIDKGWSLKQLAEHSNIGKTTIYAVTCKDGNRSFTTEILFKIATALEVKASELIIDD